MRKGLPPKPEQEAATAQAPSADEGATGGQDMLQSVASQEQGAPAEQGIPAEQAIQAQQSPPADACMLAERHEPDEPAASSEQSAAFESESAAGQAAAVERPDAKRYVPIDDSAEIDPRAAIARFFDAFAVGDASRMAACYHPMASYSNPVFPDLRGAWPGTMWKLALSRAEELQVHWDIAYADDRKAQVVWRASWRERGRARHIEAAATIALWDGDIVRHVDEFRFARWAAQTVGVSALLLAWLPAFQRAVQQRARAALDRFATVDSSRPS